jgi:HAD superfamily hydrolase (TIGR01549 family)
MMLSAAPRAVLLDLFGTVVHFAPRVPTVQVAGNAWRSAMHWLQETAARELPQLQFDDVLAALMRVTEDIVRERPPEYREIPSRERFHRALRLLGVDAACAPTMAERLSLAHMQHLASLTVLPAGHTEVLERLAARYRLALVSNFDHAVTARRILADHGVTHFFSTIVISDECGRRKPHPAIFAAALQGVGVRAEQALFVGDSIADDVVGAHGVQLPVVWLNAKRDPLPPDTPAPAHVITHLSELPALLDQR